MNLLDRIKTMLHLSKVINDKPKSKHRKGRNTGLENRKERLKDNLLLAKMPEHPFKPLRKTVLYASRNGHNYLRLVKKAQLGKLKPKQISMLNYKLESAGLNTIAL